MMDVMETVGVSVATIDGLDAAERLVTDRTILKVDTQGFDHAVLLGATNALRRIAGVIFEVPVIAIYEGVRHYADTFQLLERAGFGLYALSPIAREHGAMCVMEADAIWLRRHDGNPIP